MFRVFFTRAVCVEFFVDNVYNIIARIGIENFGKIGCVFEEKKNALAKCIHLTKGHESPNSTEALRRVYLENWKH